MIKVINIKEFGIKQSWFRIENKIPANWIYIGRGSVLGNWFKITPKTNRKQVIQLYKEWLWFKIKIKDQPVLAELARLVLLHKHHGELVLCCHCKPLPCHGDIIKSCLEWIETKQLKK